MNHPFCVHREPRGKKASPFLATQFSSGPGKEPEGSKAMAAGSLAAELTGALKRGAASCRWHRRGRKQGKLEKVTGVGGGGWWPDLMKTTTSGRLPGGGSRRCSGAAGPHASGTGGGESKGNSRERSPASNRPPLAPNRASPALNRTPPAPNRASPASTWGSSRWCHQIGLHRRRCHRLRRPGHWPSKPRRPRAPALGGARVRRPQANGAPEGAPAGVRERREGGPQGERKERCMRFG